jgi:hypothetical protein
LKNVINEADINQKILKYIPGIINSSTTASLKAIDQTQKDINGRYEFMMDRYDHLNLI